MREVLGPELLRYQIPSAKFGVQTTKLHMLEAGVGLHDEFESRVVANKR